MSVCASRESENLIVLQIELKIFFITALHHAGQCLKIFDRLTIESKNLKGREQQYLSRELEWTKIRLKKKNTKNVSSDLCINNVFVSYINVGYKNLRAIQNTYKPLKKDEQKKQAKDNLREKPEKQQQLVLWQTAPLHVDVCPTALLGRQIHILSHTENQ